MHFPAGAEAKNLPANPGDARDTGSIPGLGRSHSSIPTWKIPWPEELGWVQFMGLQSRTGTRLSMHACHIENIII